jgi:hypothetical protein
LTTTIINDRSIEFPEITSTTLTFQHFKRCSQHLAACKYIPAPGRPTVVVRNTFKIYIVTDADVDVKFHSAFIFVAVVTVPSYI